ncbi:MAG: hypothetical protein RMK84_19295 [Oscillochloridaceae bacterium]|nr:hypothetical protein [Chloroflexaceae bacterium]MDW8392272.1 hypothetical protein [Oscillochloridaceae bacterium]
MIFEREALIAKLQERLEGRIDATELAQWAFDRFYELDQGLLAVESGDVDVIADVLDELLFADDTRFALDETDLRRLIARLQEP